MGPPKAKEKDISWRIFNPLFPPGFEPGTSSRGRNNYLGVESFATACEMTQGLVRTLR